MQQIARVALERIAATISGLIIGGIYILLSVIVFILPGGLVVAALFKLLRTIGIQINIVGPPDSISPGAILLTVLYLFFSSLIVFILIGADEKPVAIIISCSSIIGSYLIYFMVKNAMWL